MGRSPALLLMLLGTVAAASGMDVFPDPQVAIEIDPDAQPAPAGMVPGRMAPAALPELEAVTFTWDDSRTVVVVDAPAAGKGLRAPAWVVTYDLQDHVEVAYRATAFLDKDGLLQIDARNAIIIGPRQEGWSPDSFAIGKDGAVMTIDDRNDAKTGTVTETVKGRDKDSAYRRILAIAVAIVRDAS